MVINTIWDEVHPSTRTSSDKSICIKQKQNKNPWRILCLRPVDVACPCLARTSYSRHVPSPSTVAAATHNASGDKPSFADKPHSEYHAIIYIMCYHSERPPTFLPSAQRFLFCLSPDGFRCGASHCWWRLVIVLRTRSRKIWPNSINKPQAQKTIRGFYTVFVKTMDFPLICTVVFILFIALWSKVSSDTWWWMSLLRVVNSFTWEHQRHPPS